MFVLVEYMLDFDGLDKSLYIALPYVFHFLLLSPNQPFPVTLLKS